MSRVNRPHRPQQFRGPSGSGALDRVAPGCYLSIASIVAW
jgi:hypothetical protein